MGALLPTSQRAVSDMLDLAPIAEADLIVEFGAGSGVYTHELLRRMKPEARLIAFEVDGSLVARIRAETDDPRLQLVAGSAEDVEQYLEGGTGVDILVSALPFTSLPGAVRQRVLDLSPKILAANGAMLVLQYSPFIQRELHRRFVLVERRISPINVPPAFLFRCSQ